MSKANESVIKEALGLVKLVNAGHGGGGCISAGSAYETDKYGQVFIKFNSKSGARTMFDGEFASLKAIHATKTVKCPKPIQVVDLPDGGAALIMEYLDMSQGLNLFSATLGEQLARLHLHNSTLLSGKSPQSTDRFGFPVNTCCGYLAMDNTWCQDWPTFYAKKIEKHLDLLRQKGRDKEARDLWDRLQPKYGTFFEGLEIVPSLVHGDLWSGNACQDSSGPIVFDPASFYGHSEYDLGITYLFGGFDSDFYKAYHKLIPKAPGFEKRKELYKLFHYINHWNHFGGGYEGSTLSTLKKCIQLVGA